MIQGKSTTQEADAQQYVFYQSAFLVLTVLHPSFVVVVVCLYGMHCGWTVRPGAKVTIESL